MVSLYSNYGADKLNVLSMSTVYAIWLILSSMMQAILVIISGTVNYLGQLLVKLIALIFHWPPQGTDRIDAVNCVRYQSEVKHFSNKICLVCSF